MSNEQPSSDQIPDLDKDTAEFFITLTKDLVTGLQATIFQRIEELEQTVESVEKQLATLIVAYGEQAAFIEALTGQLAFASDDARKMFHETLNKTRNEMLQVMKDESKNFLGDENPDLAATISDLADQQLSSTDQ
jgi:hypothetical protein